MSTHATSWLAWSLAALSVAFLVGGIVLARAVRSTAPELPNGSTGDAYSIVFGLATVLTFSVVGAIIASRHPRNAIGWMFCGVGLVEGLDTLTRGFAEFWLASGWGSRSLAQTAAWFSSWAWTPLVIVPTTFLLLLFPDGRLPSARWRPVAWLAAFGIIGFVGTYALDAGPLDDLPQIRNPYGVDSIVLRITGIAAALVLVAAMVASAVSLIVRARRAGKVERQQTKWLAYGGAVVVGVLFVGGLISIWSLTVSIAVTTVALLGVPVCTGVAIARYRLYDIDLIINRTLVYGSLTALLVVGYFGSILLLAGIGSLVFQVPIRALTGQKSTLAVVASTLAIAALFNPLRRRIQGFVDRRFYRSKYDARKTLEAFSAKLRDETDLQTLNNDLVGVVKETMQPAHVSLWLRPDSASRGEGSGGNP